MQTNKAPVTRIRALPAWGIDVLLLLLLTCVLPSQTPKVEVEKVATGFGFVEGPAWDPVRGVLLFSDIRNNKILKLGTDDKVTTYLDPSQRSNGLMFDAKGDLYACLGGARQLVRIDAQRKSTVLASEFGGKKLNSPNDLDLDNNGGIYFTDPRYGSAANVEQDVMGVYYVSSDAKVTRVIDSLKRPNGILLTRDGSGMYVAEPDKREIHFFPILALGRVGKGQVIFRSDRAVDGGGPDGMALDAHGRIYATYKNLLVLSGKGELVQRIPVPEKPANCTFGGKDGKTLYITARTSLYRVRTDVPGEAWPIGPHVGFRRGVGPTPPRFETVDVDKNVKIGYGVAVAEINGDRSPDIVLVDRNVVVWYENPTWKKHVITRKLTARDHVCIAARDIDGDGKAELAVGAGWNPGDTEKSGSVHFLVAQEDRTKPWRPVALPHEPTVHRMRWVRDGQGKYALVVAPLHGRGNKRGRGVGVKLLLYRPPDDPENPWTTELIDASLHQTHNLDPVQWDEDTAEELLVASREGIFVFDRQEKGWRKTQIAGPDEGDTHFRGASEVRSGHVTGDPQRCVATVEPFHGNQLVLYTPGDPDTPRRLWRRRVLADDLAQTHAVAFGDILGENGDQIVVGWRGKNGKGKVGIRLYVPVGGPAHRSGWQSFTVDDDGMACEDLCLADLDGDGSLDIVAAGRATRNLKIYFNRSSKRR